MELISVVIPIYNSEKTITKCLDTVINQTYNNLQIICVNDGSTDNSLEIIQQFKNKDNRITIIDKKNEGVSKTRNCGLRHCKGDYLIFIDSDDYISKSYIYDLYKIIKLTNAEIVKSNYHINDKIFKFKFKEDIKKIEHNEFIEEIFKNDYFNHVWGQLISMNVVKKNNIKFEDDITYGEDLLFNFKIFFKSKLNIYCNVNGYYYIENSTSITKNVSEDNVKKKINDSVYVYNSFKNIVDDKFIKAMIINKIDINLKNYVNSLNIKYENYKNIIKDISTVINKNKLSIKILKNVNFSYRKKIKLYFLSNNYYKLYYIMIKRWC